MNMFRMDVVEDAYKNMSKEKEGDYFLLLFFRPPPYTYNNLNLI